MKDNLKDEKPIRIAQIMGKWVGGGVESVVMNYYRNIDRKKIQFDFICDIDSTNIPYGEIYKLGGKIILIPPYTKIFKYQKYLKKVLMDGNYKIVHSHINTLSIFSLFAAKRANIPIRIAHSHSTTNKREWKKNFIKQLLKPLSKLFATDYMCCSEVAGRWLFGNKTYDKGKVILLNNAINVKEFEYNERTRAIEREKLCINNDRLVIGHIGRFVEQKNHEFLIDVFNEIQKINEDSMLVLAGQGPLENKIKNKVEELNLNKKVIFLGQIDEVSRIYQAFDIFILTSLYEGLPVVAVEAQAAGLLTILSSSMTKESRILETTKFISLKEKPKIWAEKIINAYHNYTRVKTNQILQKKDFDIIIEGKKLEKIYFDLINKI